MIDRRGVSVTLSNYCPTAADLLFTHREAVEIVQRYVTAMAAGDKVAVGKLDFACAYRLATAGVAPAKAFPADADPLYTACWEPIGKVHDSVIQHKDQGVNTLWPGKGSLVFLGEDFAFPGEDFALFGQCSQLGS